MGRESYHIGLSGIIYGLWGYLLVYAIMYRSLKSIVIAIIVMFLYGSFVWGLLPLHEGVSYEGHIFGGLSGGVLGYLYALKDKQHQTAVNKQVR
ncbi:GlpG protein [Photobacterium aphoticum]|uniref:GlpG protein n=1 Tax=Photobacterium aphoticum TaxID=754436 RepID=A0A090QIY1_9GAMM|nr:GlpG protein [Photobacterium aphoticum]